MSQLQPGPTATNPDELCEWKEANGPLYCPYCGHRDPVVELLDTDSRPREVLTCPKCGQSDEFLHPPFGAVLPLLGLGLSMSRAQFLAPWQARPRGLRRWPFAARLVNRISHRPRQTVQTWGWKGQDWPHLDGGRRRA